MHLFHLYHHNRFEKLMHTDLARVEFSIWLHTLARSLIAIFIPILLLTTGYDIKTVVLYYTVYMFFDVPLNFFARWFIQHVGARWAMILATGATIGFFITLGALTPDNWPLLALLALLAALYDTLYWVAHIYLFIDTGSKKAPVGKKTATLYIVRRFAGLLGPAAGAVILLAGSERILIAASVIVFVLSLIPLYTARHIDDKPNERRLSFGAFFRQFSEKKNYLSVGLFSLHRSAENVLWPLFIFVLFESVGSVAAIPIIVSLTAMLFSYFTGKIKKRDRGKMIALGSALVALVWILRLSVDLPLLYYISVFLVGLFSLLVSIPLDSNLFERGQGRDPLSAATYRNAVSMFAKFLLYGTLALLVNVFQISFVIAVGSLFVLLALNYYFVHKSPHLSVKRPVPTIARP